MCGKFTAMASWQMVFDFSQPLVKKDGDGGEDEVVTFRPMSMVPVIVWDRELRKRRVIPMRWGFPHPKNPAALQLVNARAETVDELPTFKKAFLEGQRGIVVMRTFNEGEEISASRTQQWTINPGDGIPRGFAVIWRRFERPLGPPLLAFVLVTVPASELISRITDRMPAILEPEDWATWLGEKEAHSLEVKAVLKTMEGVNWEMTKEERPKKPKTQPKPRPRQPDEDRLL